MKAVFLDRDGTINVELPNYLTDLKKLEIIESAYEAIHLLNQHQFKTIITTNQACIAKGLLEETELHRIHKNLREKLAAKEALLDDVYYCPHHFDERCFCRKPNIGMLKRAVREHGVKLDQSFIIGDRLFDIHAGKNAGCKTALVLTGYGKNTLKEMKSHHEQPDFVAQDILEAVQWIVG